MRALQWEIQTSVLSNDIMAVAISDNSTGRLESLEPLWHRSAPRRIRESGFQYNSAAAWRAWQKHLARRKRPQLPNFLHDQRPPLWWGCEAIADFGLTSAGPVEPRISDLAVTSVQDETDGLTSHEGLITAIERVALAYTLPELAGRLPADSWWDLLARLSELASDAQQLQVDLTGDAEDAVRQQLLAGELPLALGYLFPELRMLRALRAPARAALSEAIVKWTDGQGLPPGRLLGMIGPLWACWTRARWMGARMNRGPWSREAEIQYQWLVRHAIRLTHTDGRFMLRAADESSEDDAPSRKWPKGLYATALDLVGDAADHAAASAALPRDLFSRFDRRRHRVRGFPDVSLNSEWAGVAVLASDWSRSAARLAVNWASEPIKIEVSSRCERLLAGEWEFRTVCNDEPVSVVGEWEQTCWQSDKKCDYLELSMELSHGLRLERQILLSREDRVIYLADVVLSADGTPRHLAHTSEWSLGPNAVWQPEAETRDGVIRCGKERAAVLPLAISEWRTDSRGGRLDAADGRLTLTQESTGRALCCPILFDLDRKRSKKERTWRQLTVAEALEAVPRDAAVGYRAQSGRSQWLFYRSLDPAGNRTLVGQNIAGEFCCGRLLKSGKLDEWIEIEACSNDE
jgi:hypothetical protein